MKKNFKFMTIFILVILLYISFFFVNRLNNKRSDAPVIRVPEGVLEISVKDKEKKLLEGITVTDDVDGDLKERLSIENISTFDKNMERTVTYIVFDSEDNISRATRKIKYRDYQKPVFDIVEPLFIKENNRNNYKKYLNAKSVLDGNLSLKINIDNYFKKDDVDYLTFSIKDSCGVIEKLTLRLTPNIKKNTIDINLDKYLLRVPKGTSIHPLDYVKSVNYLGMKNNHLIDEINVRDDYNPYQEGTYEFIYSLDVSGQYGLTKLVVIVE